MAGVVDAIALVVLWASEQVAGSGLRHAGIPKKKLNFLKKP